MIFRFSLYGFLKNQKYYEPFLILAFREKGLSFLQIGALVAFREVCLNLMEVPSGAVADLYGRRRCMLLCLGSFIVSFAAFALSSAYWHLFVAMGFFALGDAFRTGTHKAIILHWLDLHGRADDKTRIYGLTRSWSQLGSAVSVLIAAVLVFHSGSYTTIFWFCIIPYAIGLINILGYPPELDGRVQGKVSLGLALRHTWSACVACLRRKRLRGLLLESAGFQGMFKVAQDYLQPVLAALALSSPVLTRWQDPRQRAALVVGVVFFLLHVLDGMASRQSHRVQDRLGGEDRSARVLWCAAAAAYAILSLALWADLAAAAAAGFLLLAVVHNLWRPLQVGRVASAADSDKTATILSVEWQAMSAFAAVAAPALGWAVDRLAVPAGAASAAADVARFLPVGILGLVVSAALAVRAVASRVDAPT